MGDRDTALIHNFIDDLASRFDGRIQVTTDGFGPYTSAVPQAFDGNVDYAQQIKVFGGAGQYSGFSEADLVDIKIKLVEGSPNEKYISTAYVERANLTIRMENRRFGRRTNAHSKALRQHEWAFALWSFNYNFIRKHSTIKMTPAEKAGFAEKAWTTEDLLEMADKFIAASDRDEEVDEWEAAFAAAGVN